jgi:hypothetical protein
MFENNRVADSAFGAAMKVLALYFMGASSISTWHWVLLSSRSNSTFLCKLELLFSDLLSWLIA